MRLSNGVLLTRAKIGIGVAVPLLLLLFASPGLSILRRRKQPSSTTNTNTVVRDEVKDLPGDCPAGCEAESQEAAIHIAPSDVLDTLSPISRIHAPDHSTTSHNAIELTLMPEPNSPGQAAEKISADAQSPSPPRPSKPDLPPIAQGILSALSKQVARKQENTKPAVTPEPSETPVLEGKAEEGGGGSERAEDAEERGMSSKQEGRTAD